MSPWRATGLERGCGKFDVSDQDRTRTVAEDNTVLLVNGWDARFTLETTLPIVNVYRRILGPEGVFTAFRISISKQENR